jgi:hypothetical protein
VLSYIKGKWQQVAALGVPEEPGTVRHRDALDLFSEASRIAVAEISGGGTPDFLVKFAGSGCFTGAVVSQVGGMGGWRYLPFSGLFPASDIVGGNPRLEGHVLVTDNACTAVPAAPAHRYSWTWTYRPSSRALVGVEHEGWPPNPAGQVNRP